MNRPPVSVGSLRGTATVCRPRARDGPGNSGFRCYIAAWKEGADGRHDTGSPGSPRRRRRARRPARTVAAAFPRCEPARDGRSASALAGPRLLTLGQLERIRDELADRVESFRSNPGAKRLEQMRLAPERHRWETVTSADLGE